MLGAVDVVKFRGVAETNETAQGPSELLGVCER